MPRCDAKTARMDGLPPIELSAACSTKAPVFIEGFNSQILDYLAHAAKGDNITRLP